MNSPRTESEAGQSGSPRTGGAGRCAACEDPRRAEIDAALAAGSPSLRQLAVKYGITKSSLARHRAAHDAGLVAVHEAAPSAMSDAPIMDEALALVRSCKRSLDSAAAGGSLNQVQLHHGQLRQALGLLAELLEKDHRRRMLEGITIDLTKTDEWVELRTLILHALHPFPDAYRALGDALGEASKKENHETAHDHHAATADHFADAAPAAETARPTLTEPSVDVIDLN